MEKDAENENAGESALHRWAKQEIAAELKKHPNVTDLKLERYLDAVRPDISCYVNGIPLAIEIQRSHIRPAIIHYRTREYSRRGISILWISPYATATDLRGGHYYNLRDWERVIHAMYFGTFYYWIEGEQLLPVHFEDALTHKSAIHLSSNLEIAHVRETVRISELTSIILPFKFTHEIQMMETRLWGLPEVWIDQENGYLPIADTQATYPQILPPVRPFIPLLNPFQAESAASDSALQGFTVENIPELQSWFQVFYLKYAHTDHKIIWVSIDHSPNRLFYPADWWDHFRSEYQDASSLKKAALIEMLSDKLDSLPLHRSA